MSSGQPTMYLHKFSEERTLRHLTLKPNFAETCSAPSEGLFNNQMKDHTILDPLVQDRGSEPLIQNSSEVPE